MASVSYGATGINFSDYQTPEAVDTAAMESELLDHYEEGDWTGMISDGTNNMTMGTDDCTYTRIGNSCALYGYLATSSVGSASGAIRITGLPFAIATGNKSYSSPCTAYARSLNITVGYTIGFYGATSASQLRMEIWDTTSGSSDMTAAEWSNDGDVMLGGTYRI